MDKNQLIMFKNQMETILRSLLSKTLQNAQDLPEMTHGLMVMTAAGNFCENMKKEYFQLKKDFENFNQSFGLSEKEYKRIVDDITSKVLGEFIELPNNPSFDDNSDFY